MSGYMIKDRRHVKEIPALDVEDKELATQLADMPLSEVDNSLEPYTHEPAKDVLYDIKPLKLHFGEFLRHHSLAADSNSFGKQFKHLLPGVVGNATVLTMGDVPVATFRRDTKLAVKRLQEEQPHIVAQFTKMKWVEVFDEDEFRKKMPDMHAAYRGRSFRLKKAGPGAGLILPTP